MLGNVLDRVDVKLYDSWKKIADNYITLFVSGYEKIEFTKHVPDEIEAINQALQILRQTTVSREQYLAALATLKEQLAKLATSKDFMDNDVNNFIFLAHRSASWVHGALLTEYNKYADAFLNPSGKENAYQEGAIEHKLVGKAARGIVSYLLQNYENQIQSVFELNVSNLVQQPNIHAKTPKDVLEPISLLANRMSKEQYESVQSQIHINSVEDIPKYLTEQTYGASFEFFYTQVATLYQIKSKINSIAVGASAEEIEKERQRLFHEAGFSDLNTKAAKKYLNDIANKLGFKNAKDLYKNYKTLNTPEGYFLFKKMKMDFVENGHMDLSTQDDPLENIKKIVIEENQRIVNKAKTPYFNQANANYIKVINFTSNELLSGINHAQSIRNVTQAAGPDLNKMMGTGLLANAGMFLANWQKGRIESYALDKFKGGGELLLRRVNDDVATIYDLWLIKADENNRIKREIRDKIIEKAGNSIDDHDLVHEFIEAMITYKRNFQEYNKAQSLDKDSSEFASIKKQFKDAENQYNNYRDAFSLCANDNIFRLTKDNIEQHIKQRELAIAKINENYKLKVSEINNIRSDINGEMERRQKTVRGTLTRWRDNVASVFGIKTKSMINMQEKQENLNKAYKELEPIGLALHIQVALKARTSKLKQQFEDANKQSSKELLNSIRLKMSNIKEDYLKIKSEIEISTKDNTALIFNLQEQLRESHNILAILMNELVLKLNNKSESETLDTLSLQDLVSSLNEVNSNKREFVNFDRKIIGSNIQTNVPFEQLAIKLSETINDRKLAAQETLLAKAKKVVSAAYANFNGTKELCDPFKFIQTLPECNLSDLSANSISQLNQHVAKEAISLFSRTSDKVALKDLEIIYLSLQTASNQLTLKNNRTTEENNLLKYYQEFSTIVKQSISTNIQQANKLSAVELRNKLSDLNSELLYLKEKSLNSVKTVEKLKATFDSRLWNLLGFVTQQSIEHAEASARADEELLQLYSDNYATILKSFHKKATPNYAALNYEDLTQFIHEIDQNIEKLKSQDISASCIGALEDILKEAQLAEKSHTRHLETSIHHDIQAIESQMLELAELQEDIDSEVSEKSEANLERIAKYQVLRAQISTNVKNAFASLADLESKRTTLLPLYKELGTSTFEEDMLRKLYSSRLDKIQKSYDSSSTLYAVPFEVYATITDGLVPSKMENLSKTALGKALIMAVNKQNLNAAEAILNKNTSQNGIDLYELSAALTIAASQGRLELFKSILNYRKDIVFSHEHLNAAFTQGLINDKQDIVNYIMFNTDFMPDIETLKTILESTSDESVLSGVERGFRQMLVDNDGPTLQDIRKWYIFLNQLTDSLKLEESILVKTAKHTHTTAGIEALNHDAKQLADKVERIRTLKGKSENMIRYLYTENLERRKEHIQKWEQEIDLALRAFDVSIASILYPQENLASSFTPSDMGDEITPESYATPPIPQSTVLDEIQQEIETQNVRIQLTNLQKLVSHGVIVPEIQNTNEIVVSEAPANQNSVKRDELQDLEDKINTILNKPSVESPENLMELRSLLKQVKHHESDTQNKLSSILQKAIYKMAKENNATALIILLDFADNQKLDDVLTTALSQAIHSEKGQAASLLIKKHAYAGHEKELFEKILSLFEKNKSSTIGDIGIDFLTHVKTSNLINTRNHDERIINLIASKVSDNQAITYVSRSLAWNDFDKPKLEQLRTAFLFAQQTYEKLPYSTYIDLQKIQEADPEDLTEAQLAIFENELKQVTSTYEAQLDGIENVVNLLKESIPIDNASRKEQYISIWEKETNLKEKKDTCKEGIEKEIKDAQKVIEKARKILHEKANASAQPGKRKSLLPSQGHKPPTNKDVVTDYAPATSASANKKQKPEL